MIWLVFAVASAVFTALSHVTSKSVVEEFDSSFLGGVRMFFPGVLIVACLYGVQGGVELGGKFWLALLVCGTLNVGAFWCLLKSYTLSDVSLVAPLLSLCAPLVLITEFVITGSIPSMMGIAGVCVVAAGAYLLGMTKAHGGILAPFKRLGTDRGARLVVCTACLWGVTPVFDKMGVMNSSPTMWLGSLYAFIGLGLLIIAYKYIPAGVRRPVRPWLLLVVVAVVSTLGDGAGMFALDYAPAAYVASVKQSNGLITVVLAAILFKEKNVRERLFGSILMIVGVALISFS